MCYWFLVFIRVFIYFRNFTNVFLLNIFYTNYFVMSHSRDIVSPFSNCTYQHQSENYMCIKLCHPYANQNSIRFYNTTIAHVVTLAPFYLNYGFIHLRIHFIHLRIHFIHLRIHIHTHANITYSHIYTHLYIYMHFKQILQVCVWLYTTRYRPPQSCISHIRIYYRMYESTNTFVYVVWYFFLYKISMHYLKPLCLVY